MGEDILADNSQGTFTDLRSQINNSIAAGQSSLDLPYNFTYVKEIDGNLKGVTINGDLIINGNGYTKR